MMSTMADRIFYTLHRFFEELHGPGDSAEVAALFTWSLLLALNIGTILVVFTALVGTPTFLHDRISYVFAAVGLGVTASQYIRYLTGSRLRKLGDELSAESRRQRYRRRWISLGFVFTTLLAFCCSLWLLSAVRSG